MYSPFVAVSGSYTLFIEYDVAEGGGGWCFVNLDGVQIIETGPSTFVPNWDVNR